MRCIRVSKTPRLSESVFLCHTFCACVLTHVKGRYREFYQCDFDIAGDYERPLPDAEILRVLSEVCRALCCEY